MYLGFNRGRSFSAVPCPRLSFRLCPKSKVSGRFFWHFLFSGQGIEEGSSRFGTKAATWSCLSSCAPSPLPFQQPQSSCCLNPLLLGVWPASREGNPDPLTTPKRVQPLLWKLELLSGWGGVAQPIPTLGWEVVVLNQSSSQSHCGIDSPLFLSIQTPRQISRSSSSPWELVKLFITSLFPRVSVPNSFCSFPTSLPAASWVSGCRTLTTG